MNRRVIAVLLALAPPTGAAAQAGMPDSVLGDLAGHLEGQSRIRVSRQGEPAPAILVGPRLVGGTIHFESYAPAALPPDTAGRPLDIPLAEITRIQVRGGAWDKGAIVGFLAGALAIGAVNLAGKYQIDRGETLWFELLFGSGGAAFGAPIGGLFSEWRTVYQRDAP
jgi:hypothetical protein